MKKLLALLWLMMLIFCQVQFAFAQEGESNPVGVDSVKPDPTAAGGATTSDPSPTSDGGATETPKNPTKKNPDGSITFELNTAFPGESNSITTSRGAIGILEEYISQVFVFGGGVVVILAVLWSVVGGYEMMFSGTEGITSGKEKIILSAGAIALLFLSGLLLNFINPGFFLL